MAVPGQLVGTDSHTTMINGLGVVGWGVGGIEAEAAMVGQPIYMLLPEVVGFKLTGKLPEGSTATDLVLRVTEMLREHGVVDKFVEFHGPGLSRCRWPIGRPSPTWPPNTARRSGSSRSTTRCSATCASPADDDKLIETVEQYYREQGLWRDDPGRSTTPRLSSWTCRRSSPALAGPRGRRTGSPCPQWEANGGRTSPTCSARTEGRRRPLSSAGRTRAASRRGRHSGAKIGVDVSYDGSEFELTDGDVVIAAITSCTNTSNPDVMVGGRPGGPEGGREGSHLAALGEDQSSPPDRRWSPTISRDRPDSNDLEGSASTPSATAARPASATAARCRSRSRRRSKSNDLVAAAVLSRQPQLRRPHQPDVKANYLASPPLVVAYALAGTTDIDFEKEPIGTGRDGEAGLLARDLADAGRGAVGVEQCVLPEMFERSTTTSGTKTEKWNAIKTSDGDLYNGIGEHIHPGAAFLGRAPEGSDTDLTGARRPGLVFWRLRDDRPHLAPRARSPQDARPVTT